MATSAWTISYDNTTDAAFRAWGLAISSRWASMGLVQTADSGQIDWTTVAHPTVVNQSMGYEIWRLDDGLQGSAPVFIKVEYGSGPNDFHAASVWVTVGTGTNGAGTLTGKVTPRNQVQDNFGTSGLRANYMSGAVNRLAMHLFRTAGSGGWSSSNGFFSLERTHDASGADTDEGVLVVWAGPTTSGGSSGYVTQALLFTLSAAQTHQDGPATIVNNGDGSGIDGSDVNLFPWSISTRRGHMFPCRNVVSYWNGDVSADNVATIVLYGINHTFVFVGGSVSGGGMPNAGYGGGAVVGDASLAMRYE